MFSDGSVEIEGWALDPDTTDPIFVWVTVDGVGEHLLANEPREDIAAAFPAHGPDHGFFGAMVFDPGTYRICVTASNVGPGSHKLLGCEDVAVTDGSPIGNLERVRGVHGGVQVKGWTIDPDTGDSIFVWITVDGVGRHAYADKSRPDVGAVFPDYGDAHGFDATVPATAGSHQVCVTASNVGAGSHTSLGCRTVTVPSMSPYGNFERASAVPGGIEVKGWAIDPDTAAPIYVWVTVDGVGRHLRADKSRPDVGAAFPSAGSAHGFQGTLPAGAGRHTVCVTASNVGAGSHTSLGCRSVTVA